MRGIRHALWIAGVALACTTCTNPDVQLKQEDEIQQVAESVNQLRTEIAGLESTIDSLNAVILKQDTALRLIVDFTGAQVPSYRKQQ